MVEVANRRGYADASVAAAIAEAGVSRATFYEHFSDRDECFRASLEDVQSELLDTVEQALEALPAQAAMAGAVQRLVAYASSEPARARFLMGESMAGGPGALAVRDRGIEQIAAAIEQAQGRASAQEPLADLDARVLLGSVYRMIATRLRRGEVAISELDEELVEWLVAYRRATARRRWQTLAPGPAPARSPHLPSVPIKQMPAVLPRGRPSLSQAEIFENHRLRVLYASARMAVEKGYTATTVEDITKLASVDGRAFYRQFSDKQEAFTALHEVGFQLVMDAMTKAFFAVEGWPLRSWEAIRALAYLLQVNPPIAHVNFVEAYAAGPGAVQRIADSQVAFMFFLQEGLAYEPHASPPSRVAMEAIVAGTFEIIYLQARADDTQIASMVGQIAHLWLTPFLGADEADAFIRRQQKSANARR
jgi:AcrR family transcriptional regulator